MNPYEATLILKPTLQEKEAQKIAEEISGEIAKNGGEVKGTNLSPKQRLAYSVAKYNQGIYLRLNFLFQPKSIGDFSNHLNRNKKILRHLIIRGKQSEFAGAASRRSGRIDGQPR